VEPELAELVLQRLLRRVERQLHQALEAHLQVLRHLEALRSMTRGSRRTIRPSKNRASGSAPKALKIRRR